MSQQQSSPTPPAGDTAPAADTSRGPQAHPTGAVGALFARAVRVTATAVRGGLSLFVRFFPALLTLVALGMAGRGVVLWLASRLSDSSPLAGSLLVPLAPMCVLASLVAALWVMRPGTHTLSQLPAVDLDSSTSGPEYQLQAQPRRGMVLRTHLLTVGGLLVPFLGVYASNGFLKEDVHLFIGQSALNEQAHSFADTDLSRVALGATWQVAALVVVAVVLRKIIGYFALGKKGLGWSGTAAYIEILWISTISVIITANTAALKEWTATRAVFTELHSRIDAAIAAVTGVDDALTTAIAKLGGVLAAADDVVVVPVAWLTVGAVVFGTTLAAAPPKKTPAPAAPATDSGAGAAAAAPTTAAAASTDSSDAAAWNETVRTRAAAEAERYLQETIKPVAGPAKAIWAGVKKIAAAGLIPMLTLCVAILCARAVEAATVAAVHALIGPQWGLMVDAVTAWELLAGRIAYFVVVLPLVAAGVDAVIGATLDTAEADTPEGSAAPATSHATV
ncbi:hypothetical protein C1Y63_01895 [Corynebacterium sp. 13CS0277]|uniref:hypothetical protein n=1 Tax=Corynebacterium sp. 13CS0277 TaxID=2071994 RepID=UPI000D038B72|nr:hypothetical protein [Corynebacterium sp. 13CS0277]PRQ12327.1 hypothetical protein C1Y63_01895 [Corynebacterium sp. 13CS0277]